MIYRAIIIFLAVISMVSLIYYVNKLDLMYRSDLNSYKNKCFSNGGIEFRVKSGIRLTKSYECIYKNDCTKGFCELKR